MDEDPPMSLKDIKDEIEEYNELVEDTIEQYNMDNKTQYIPLEYQITQADKASTSIPVCQRSDSLLAQPSLSQPTDVVMDSGILHSGFSTFLEAIRQAKDAIVSMPVYNSIFDLGRSRAVEIDSGDIQSFGNSISMLKRAVGIIFKEKALSPEEAFEDNPRMRELMNEIEEATKEIKKQNRITCRKLSQSQKPGLRERIKSAYKSIRAPLETETKKKKEAVRASTAKRRQDALAARRHQGSRPVTRSTTGLSQTPGKLERTVSSMVGGKRRNKKYTHKKMRSQVKKHLKNKSKKQKRNIKKHIMRSKKKTQKNRK